MYKEVSDITWNIISVLAVEGEFNSKIALGRHDGTKIVSINLLLFIGDYLMDATI